MASSAGDVCQRACASGQPRTLHGTARPPGLGGSSWRPRRVLVLGPSSSALGMMHWSRAGSPLVTPFSADVHPNMTALHPRPSLHRGDGSWQSLDGLWQLAIEHGVPSLDAPPVTFATTILVPYPVESALSGVRARAVDWSPSANASRRTWSACALWYRRTFAAFPPAAGGRAFLRFEAVASAASVRLNGVLLGVHEGEYDDFSFDITDVQCEGRANELVVGVLHNKTTGKQDHSAFDRPQGISYAASSGIWQSVWLERTAATVTINDAFATSSTLEGMHLHFALSSECPGCHVAVTMRAGALTLNASAPTMSESVAVWVGVPARVRWPWSPSSPHLYEYEATLLSAAAVALDEVHGRAALRTVSVHAATPGGQARLLLNGKLFFLVGTLDQGFFPEGLYTPPTDAALTNDLRTLKDLGFNAVRKHMKIESRRYYHHADALGVLVLQDVPAGVPPAGVLAMVRRCRPHGAVVGYTLYNEGWGQPWGAPASEAQVREAVDWLLRADSTRLVDVGSGWHQAAGGSVLSSHSYPLPSAPSCVGIAQPSAPNESRGHFAVHNCTAHAHMSTEYGGLVVCPNWLGRGEWFDAGHERFFGAYLCPGYARAAGSAPCARAGDGINHSSGAGWGSCTCSHGYGTADVEKLMARGGASAALATLYSSYTARAAAMGSLSGIFYTQTSDVETEANGLMTYDRLLKLDASGAKQIRGANDLLQSLRMAQDQLT
uniref:Glycosyl hydrolases family 2 sugar binding domain-containing protein n=1 Tax=Calcidiscus leptoporus TaxID=127549 RepID=A0A7S0P5D4_9EUKA